LGSIENLFETGETFKHVEIGWYDTWDARFSDNYHLSVWQIDARSAADVGSGWGAVISGQRTIAERWTPFLRAGYAKGGGTLVDRSVSVGTEYTLFGGRDQLGIGLNWGRAPQGTTLAQFHNQYSAEVFYRYQPFKKLQITPDIQYLVNPAYAPSVDRIWVAGLRLRVVF
jgi:porin